MTTKTKTPPGQNYGYTPDGKAHTFTPSSSDRRKGEGKTNALYSLGHCLGPCEHVIWTASNKPRVPICDMCRPAFVGAKRARKAKRRGKPVGRPEVTQWMQ